MSRNAIPGGVILHGGRCAVGARNSQLCSLEIRAGMIHRLAPAAGRAMKNREESPAIDLSGFLVLPGLINAHDHLEFSLFPRLAAPPYPNYIEWGADIHQQFAETIALHRSIPKDVCVAWGGIRNLLCGVTTVSHHNLPLAEKLDENLPIRVLRNYGWGHSHAFGGNLCVARSATPAQAPFILHACEGTDEVARREVWELDRLGLLDANAVLVHGLALDQRGVGRLVERRSSLIVCPSSNQFLFHALPDLSLLRSVPHLTLGNDSPLTAQGDLLDELRFAVCQCGITPEAAFTMVTSAPATILRLHSGEGTLRPGAVGDLLAVRDSGIEPADTLSAMTMHDVELVIVGGRIQLASEAVLERLPESALSGLEPLRIDGVVRWLRAPVSILLQRAEQVLGTGQVRLGGRSVAAVG